MDHHSQLFHNRIIEAIRSGEVICLFFPRFGKTLIMDMRHTLEIPPGVIIDDMVTRPAERIGRLEELRPTMPPPEELRIAAWIGSASSLEEAGIAPALLERCADTGDVGAVERCREALQTLIRLERQHLKAVLRGDLSETLWQREDGA